MPRKARVLIPNCPHHIVQRGHNRKAIFLQEADYQYYLENLLEWKLKLSIKIYAWCLMTNHIHIIAEPGPDETSISLMMKQINGRHTAYMNTLEGRSGSLWNGRFKASPVQREAYLVKCCHYVELNPVAAGIVNHPEEYPWSSFRSRMGNICCRLFDEDDCYRRLGSTSKERQSNYLAITCNSTVIRFFEDSVNRNQLTGNNRFIDEVEYRTGLRIEARSRGRPTKISL